MNKRNIIKIILILTSLIFTICFEIQTMDLGFTILIPLLFLITIYMYKYKDKIIKLKLIYNVILMLLIFFSLLILIYIIVIILSSLKNIITEIPIILNLFNLYLIFKVLIDSIITVRTENNRINDYITIIVFLIINLVFIRYYFDISLIIENSVEKLEYIYQNYIYFFIMLFVMEMHKYISAKLR